MKIVAFGGTVILQPKSGCWRGQTPSRLPKEAELVLPRPVFSLTPTIRGPHSECTSSLFRLGHNRPSPCQLSAARHDSAGSWPENGRLLETDHHHSLISN